MDVPASPRAAAALSRWPESPRPATAKTGESFIVDERMAMLPGGEMVSVANVFIESFEGGQGRRPDGMLCVSAGDLLRSVDAMVFHCRRMKAENKEFDAAIRAYAAKATRCQWEDGRA